MPFAVIEIVFAYSGRYDVKGGWQTSKSNVLVIDPWKRTLFNA